MEHPEDTLGGVLAPVSVASFFANYWEITFCHSKNEAAGLSRYLSLGDIDDWMKSTQGSVFITPPEGTEAPTERHRPREVSASIVYVAFINGCQLVFDRMEDRPSLQGLVRSMEREFHADIGVEAHLAGRGARTLPPATSNRDLLVLNLEGERTWRLHEMSLLQLDLLEKKNFKFPLEWYGRTKTPVLAEISLKPGHVLYIPRGMPYQAVAPSGVCLHLNVSITPLSWMDFLKTAAECAALHSEELRKALPPGFVENDELCQRMQHTFEEVMKEFQAVTSFNEVLAAVKRNRVKHQKLPSDGHFRELAKYREVTLDSEVQRRRDVLCVLAELVDIGRNRRSAIFFANEHVTGPPHLRRAFEFIRDHTRFRVSNLPGLDEKGQLVLVRRLIIEGLLRKVPEAERTAQAEPVGRAVGDSLSSSSPSEGS